MKRIPLTQGKFTLVDNEDFDRLNQYRWQYNKKDDCGQRNVGVPGSRRTKTLRMAPEVLQTTKMVDHKDGNGLNNQKKKKMSKIEIQSFLNDLKDVFSE